MYDVRRLRLLHELSRRGTLAEVAAALHQSPSAVSQQLSQLEREVGQPLLRKVGRRLQLTPAAELLVEHTAVIVDRLEQAAADLATLGEEAAGTVRIAIFQSAALAFTVGMLEYLQQHHPKLRVTGQPARTRDRPAADLVAFVRSGDRRAVPGSRRTLASRTRSGGVEHRRAAVGRTR